jgi:hypothetical protein
MVTDLSNGEDFDRMLLLAISMIYGQLKGLHFRTSEPKTVEIKNIILRREMPLQEFLRKTVFLQQLSFPLVLFVI